MTDPHCHLCPGECPIPDCPFALRRGERPGTEDEEIALAHEPMTDDAEGWE